MVTRKEAVRNTRERLLKAGIGFDPGALDINPDSWTIDDIETRKKERESVVSQLMTRGISELAAKRIGLRVTGETLKKVGEIGLLGASGAAVGAHIERTLSKLER